MPRIGLCHAGFCYAPLWRSVNSPENIGWTNKADEP
nr:MAG TPA: hypothetical protein [Caudoviricetes sp.]